MTDDDIFSKVTAAHPKVIKSEVQIKDYLTLRINTPAELTPLAVFLKESLGFNYLEMVTTVDWLGPVSADGFIREPNFNPFLPDGATPTLTVTANPKVNYRPVFDMLWSFGNLKENKKVFLRLEIPRDKASVPSLARMFSGANWQERETFDLYGIDFEGHPNQTKILTPDFIAGHPLRKDYAHTKDRFDS